MKMEWQQIKGNAYNYIIQEKNVYINKEKNDLDIIIYKKKSH